MSPCLPRRIRPSSLRFPLHLLLSPLLLACLACPAPEEGLVPREGRSETTSAPVDASGNQQGTLVPAGVPPTAVEDVVAEVDPERLAATVRRLESFGTRHTLSDTESETRGIGAARRWIKAAMETQGRGTPLEVSFDAHDQSADGERIDRDTEIVNVVAVLPGTDPVARDRHYLVVAHYDSRASDVMDSESDAPGANDDASGTALVMELARVMASRKFESTLVFLATAGEEQGLFGARRYAEAARAAGVDIRAVLSNDIVGDPTNPDGKTLTDEVRVFSQALPHELTPEELGRIRALGAENDSPSRQLARFVRHVASWEGLVQPMLVFRTDRFLRGGDHTAFNDEGYPAVRFSEVSEDYTRQHQDVREEDGVAYGDTSEHVDPRYLAEVTRLNAATLTHLANAPSSPANARLITAELTNDTLIRWDASPETDVAGYEVVWRRTTSPFWQNARDAGAATELTLPVSKDTHFFGVRAYDRDGYRSPVTFAGAARE